jgi:hypothetical protein
LTKQSTEPSVLTPIVQASLNAIDINDDSYQAHFDESPDIRSASKSELKSINDFLLQKQLTIRFVRDALAAAVDKQKENADSHSRRNKNSFKVGDKVLLSTASLPTHALSIDMHNKKLRHRFIGPFRIIKKHGDAYTLDLLKSMRLHPTFYVARLKAYHSSLIDHDSDLSMVRRTPEQPNVQLPLLDPQAVVEPSSGVLPVALLPSKAQSDSSHAPPTSRSHALFHQPDARVHQPEHQVDLSESVVIPDESRLLLQPHKLSSRTRELLPHLLKRTCLVRKTIP